MPCAPTGDEPVSGHVCSLTESSHRRGFVHRIHQLSTYPYFRRMPIFNSRAATTTSLVVLILVWAGCNPPDPQKSNDSSASVGAAKGTIVDRDSGNNRSTQKDDDVDVAFADSAQTLNPTPSRWKLYKGEWFDIRYPAGFTTVKTGEEDGVAFRSPDGDVEFYVFSPLWNGTSLVARQHDVKEDVETMTEERSGSAVVRRFTYVAKDGTFRRSFEDTEDTTHNTRHIFGVRYRSLSALARYRTSYLRFKESLQQYSD